MKLRIFTFLLIAVAGLSACRKDNLDINIKQYDQQQIEAYMAANGLTDFTRDTSEGDSSGMYYKIFNKGTGEPLEYSDQVSLVFTLRSFDGKYISSDTIANHYQNFLGHLTTGNLPKGLQMAIKNVLKYRDGSMRLLIPSNLAYGSRGFGSGSITNVNTRIAGNQSLDYYVHVINNQAEYDDLVIQNYFKNNNISGYTKTPSGLYYKILVPGTSGSFINSETTVTATYVGTLLNNISFDETSKTTANAFLMSNIIVDGVSEGLIGYAKEGTSISLIMPSRLGYGTTGATNTIIAANCPLRFDYQVTKVEHP